ncbi:two-component sensor histidine kinase [Pseudanabaena sp. SR411]|uniref:sensor histidine kinase n=1 Tax=Pseudanabaena sp. SR411 TaxID=1980935 RepID=UPI000B97E551|nr:ATP-binding protein [Pseudanabaena sp. SR411]OYQ65999.1 two-component sensor histidine kinase [Pseudanabaena sp. SR411]
MPNPDQVAAQTVRSPSFWMIVGLIGIVIVLEFSTPPDYVMGYLYISPILIANSRLSRTNTFLFTLAAVFLTIINIWIPNHETIQVSMVVNRLVTVLALVVTAVLSDRYRRTQQVLVTQQAKLQAQEKIMNMREDFASTLAHDLKTPLLGAIETLHAFEREQFGKIQIQQKTVLATMIRSHQNSLRLVETLLDVYRNETEGLQLKLAPINLVTLAEEVAILLIPLSTSRNVYVNLNYGESDFRKFLWVNGDAFQLRRVFTNLLTNAINHSPRGAKVELVLETNSSNQVVQVIDFGAGIKIDEKPYLFDRFYQGQGDRLATGSGLGLYLTRQIIEAHGGTIWAENRQPQGAIFGFRLPALAHSSRDMTQKCRDNS